MTQRFKITVRGMGVELRGRVDELTDEDAPTLAQFAEAMKPFGLVIASPAEGDYDPFGISEPSDPPTIEGSRQVIEDMMSVHDDQHSLLEALAYMHLMQARVIRGERGRAEQAEKELLSRELHHFETEQENERLTNQLRRVEDLNRTLVANLEQERAEHESTLHIGQDYLRTLDAIDLTEATAIADDLSNNWEQGDLAGAVTRAIDYLREIGAPHDHE